MKKTSILLFILDGLLSAVIPCCAQIDPILINEPNPKVFDCKNDIFFEFLETPVIDRSTSGRTARGFFLMFKAEILFLAERGWDGIDKNSFSVKHTGKDGTEEVFPLDFATSMFINLRHGWKTFSDRLFFTSLTSYFLVFDVGIYSQEGWTLLFRPTERGKITPYCEVEIPISFR